MLNKISVNVVLSIIVVIGAKTDISIPQGRTLTTMCSHSFPPNEFKYFTQSLASTEKTKPRIAPELGQPPGKARLKTQL